ncbi:MAG: histidinol-phosphate transaminase [Bacteroidaceae bacterium]|nr:histidinol-phosphate transaminase [Bacteroidaceae bacterium]
MKTLQDIVRPNIWSLKPYSSARDEYKGFDAKVFLDANESPYHEPYNRYPDPLQGEVKRLLAPIKGVGEENIFLGNGSDEAIDLVFRIFCEPGVDNVVSLSPTYGMYEVCADVNNVEYRAVPLRMDGEGDFRFCADDLLGVVDGHTKAVFLCSPNNPTGACLCREELMKVLDGFEGMVVIDEAYADFMKEPSFLRLLGKYPRLIVLQTFSKAWACAGIRLGMAFASPEVIAIYNKVKYPYNVNVLTQREAIATLTDYARITAWVEELKAERTRLMEALAEYPDTEHVYPTDANFVLVRVRDAQALYDYLLTQGIIVRNRHRVQLCRNCLRITVGTPEENDALMEAMHAFVRL